MTPPIERRSVDPLTVMLTEHIQNEEDAFDRGEKRMAQIEADLQPIRRMYYAVIGSAGIGTLLLVSLVFIYQNDRTEIRNTQDALYRQGVAIERLLVSHAELEKDFRHDQSRTDTALSKLLERIVQK